MTASWTVAVDWDDDDDFTTAGDDVTARVLDARTPLTCTYGRDTARALSPIRVGEAGFELNNISRDYSPENTDSPLYGKVIPARPVTISAELDDATTTVFRGQLDDFTVKPGTDQRSVDVTCLDGLSMLRGLDISTEMYFGLRTGQALHKLLDAAEWPPELRDIDHGATVLPHWWLDNQDALEAALELVDSEGPAALLTMDPDGRVVFRDRHHRLQRDNSLTVQSTWYSKGIEPLFSAPADYDHGWKEIVNVITFEVPIRVPSPTLDVVWQAAGRVTVAAGETLPVTVKGTAPFYGALTPVEGTDYELMSGTVSIDMPRDSGESTTVFITATSTAAVLDRLQVRGFRLDNSGSVVVTAEDSSVTRYGRRTGTNLRAPRWAGLYDTQAIVQLILAHRAERLPTIRVTLVNHNDTRQTQQLTRDLSDRVHIVEYETGLDADCYIEQITHQVTQGGLEHRTTFGLEKCPAQIDDVFILGDGELGTNALGRRGFADPDTMFVLASGELGTNILAA